LENIIPKIYQLCEAWIDITGRIIDPFENDDSDFHADTEEEYREEIR
jgi:hypothetical protein